MKKKPFGCLAVCVFLLTLVIAMGRPAWAGTETITVFAAASTTNAVTDIAALYEDPPFLCLFFHPGQTD